MGEPWGSPAPWRIGRYEVLAEIAHGGMATIHVGRVVGQVGFSRIVAIKRLHAQFARDPTFAAMFVDEARLAARIHHPNVVSTLDVAVEQGELFVVMEYVQGESLARLLKASGEPLPLDVVSALAIGMLEGLHATHEARGARGEPLGIVHRDVSPQNILVGVDGIPRLIDFGVAKAAGRLQTTFEGQLKGKLSYMAPEQFDGGDPDRRVDLYSASVVLWEAIAGKRLFDGSNEAETMRRILRGSVAPPSEAAGREPGALDALVLRGLDVHAENRFATARDMALAIEEAVTPAPARRVREWVVAVAGEAIDRRAARIAEAESEGATAGISSVNDVDDDLWQALSARAKGAVPEAWRTASSSDPNDTSIRQRAREPEAAQQRPPDDGSDDTTDAQPLSPVAPPVPESSSNALRLLAVPTPLNPIRPAPLSSPPSSGAPSSSSRTASTVPPPAPGPAEGAAASGASPLGSSWSEAWDGAGWNVAYRPTSPAIVALLGLALAALAGWVVWQKDVFGTLGLLAAGVFLLGGAILLFRFARWTRIRLDASALTLEARPSGASSSLSTRALRMFRVLERGPRENPDACVHGVLVEGEPARLAVDFETDAQARWVAERLNVMLERVKAQNDAK